MFSGINNSKEVIRNRMHKYALNYWNIKNTEDLDPIVKLMLEALSTELYNLGNDIKDTEVRLLEKVANLLAPGFLTSPNPAYAIMHARPHESEEQLLATTHFYTTKDLSSKQEETKDKTVDVFFTPVDETKIINGTIMFMACGTGLNSYGPGLEKTLVAQTNSGTRIEKNAIWLGLSLDEKLTDINNLYFYFNWKNLDNKLTNFNYQLLPLCKWYISDTEVKVTEGFPYAESQQPNRQRDLSVEYDLLSHIEKDIKEFYHNKYMTVTDERFNNIGSLKEEYPASFNEIFPQADLKKMAKKLLWVKIIFPTAMQQESLDDLFVYINCFPVMNRELKDKKPYLKNGSNIIPLKTSGLDQFLSVRSLSDMVGHQYNFTAFRKPEQEETGTFTLRTSGIERFDGRNAKEFISYMLELLRSESAAFSGYNNDFIRSTLVEMDQKIASMEQNTRDLLENAAETPHYIIAKPYEDYGRMYVDYWVTLAETGNSIRSETKMNEYKGVKTNVDSLFLMTTTAGGKKRLKPEDKVSAFRYGLMTRNRIVTKEDIRNLCLYELGSRISKVSVDKGFDLSPHPKQSFYRTIDITLTPSQTEKVSSDAWQVLFDQLKSKLQSRSGMSSHYRIFLNNN